MHTNPVLNETLLTFVEAALRAPRVSGKARSVQTIYKWVGRGVKIGGQRIKLECARVGGRRVTSVEAMERFLEAVSATPSEPVPIRSPHARQKASEAAAESVRRRFASYAKQRAD